MHSWLPWTLAAGTLMVSKIPINSSLRVRHPTPLPCRVRGTTGVYRPLPHERKVAPEGVPNRQAFVTVSISYADNRNESVRQMTKVERIPVMYGEHAPLARSIT